MRRGQIGTESPQRVIFIWEGAVAALPDHKMVRAWERVCCNLARWDQAVGYWKAHTWALALMWSLNQRTPWRIDICVTSRGPSLTKALSARVTQENWPVRYVFCEPDLGRKLAQMPDVERVFYGIEEQRFQYGPQGYFLDPSQPITVS